jgi:hypothetical protein
MLQVTRTNFGTNFAGHVSPGRRTGWRGWGVKGVGNKSVDYESFPADAENLFERGPVVKAMEMEAAGSSTLVRANQANWKRFPMQMSHRAAGRWRSFTWLICIRLPFIWELRGRLFESVTSTALPLTAT